MKDEIKNGIIILISVLVILGATYLITAYFKGSLKGKNEVTESSVSYDAKFENMIILSKVFNIEDSEYKVLFYSNKKIKDSLSNTIKSYDSSKKDIKLYKVNYDESINKKVLSNQDNTKATNAEELKVKGITLITIKDNKIVSYITNEDEILSALE